jgi:hypothetical protein
MNYDDYRREVYEDTIQYIKDCEYLNNFADPDPDYRWGEREFYDMMDEAELSVTGNDNGSYYCNSYKAQEALKDAVFDTDILSELFAHCFEDSFWRYMREGDYEAADVIVRCVIFLEVQSDVQAWIEEQIGKELD